MKLLIHSHPLMEKTLNVPEGHVIIDLNIFYEIKRIHGDFLQIDNNRFMIPVPAPKPMTNFKIRRYKNEVKILLIGLGHPEALVTDLSGVIDFIPLTTKDSDTFIQKVNSDLKRITHGIRFEIEKDDLLVDAAKRLRAAAKRTPRVFQHALSELR